MQLSRVEEFNKLMVRSSRMLEQGKMISEKDLKIDRQQFKSIVAKLKERKGLDILTIQRGHRTIGWVLASKFGVEK